MLARPGESGLTEQDKPIGFAMWWDFLGKSKVLNSSGLRREVFSGAPPLELFCPDWQKWATGLSKWSSSVVLPGEVSGQQQEHTGDSCKEIAWRETWIPAADLGPRQTRTSTGVVCVDVFQRSECQLSLQGMLVWYLPNVFEGRFVFLIGVTCPCRINPLTFFSSLLW